MPDNSLKLTSSNHHIQFTEALGTLTCCQLKIFLHSRMKGLLQHGVVNELSPLLARLTFYENLFTGQGTSVCCPHLRVSVLSQSNLEKMYGLSTGTKKPVRDNEVSVLSGCP